MNSKLTLIFPLFLLLAPLSAQQLGVLPAASNPTLRSEYNNYEKDQATRLRQQFGLARPSQAHLRGEDCAPEFTGILAPAGKTIIFSVDTFGLADDTTTPILTILPVPAPKFGQASINDIFITYSSDPGFDGAAIDTLLVEYSQPSDIDTITVIIYVVRRGRSVVTDGFTIAPQAIQPYCLGDELNFAAPMYCSEFLPSANTYDGRGRQNFHFTSYHYADTCIVYYSSRFPGQDTVSVRICDELTVCDTFLIPVTITGDTLTTLPFFDDFSENDGPWPTADRWLDDDVFVNTTLAPNPPSVGLVTFDGLDRRGRAYDIFEGKADQLTSEAIDLSGFSPAQGLFLKFYLAPKGYGLEPEKVDSFTVEFRNAQRQWVRVSTITGLDDVPLDSFPPFLAYSLALDEAQFFHSAFQFRFTNYVSPGGYGDFWHLDYVRLAVGEGSGHDFNDVAFTQLPTPLLKNSTAMPWWHFSGYEGQELTDTLFSQFFNLFPDERALSNSAVNFREVTLGIPFNQGFTVTQMNEENKLPPKVPQQRQRIIPPDKLNEIIQKFNEVPDGDFRLLETTYSLSQTSQTGGFFINDTVRLYTPFDNYFAHDDGTAEWQLFVKFASGGEQFATRFRANMDDTLRAVQFLFPHVNGDIESQVFNLRIWSHTLDSEPIYEQQLLKPFFPDNVFDTLQGFTNYRLQDFLGRETPVFLPAGDFWIGFQQVTAAGLGIPIGFDLQNPCNCNYVNLSGTWSLLPANLQGALMIRPVVGDKAPPNTTAPTHDPEVFAAEIVEVFPNPTAGQLNFRLKSGQLADYTLHVYDATGRVLRSEPLMESTSIADLAPGIFVLWFENEKTGEAYPQRISLLK